MTACRGIRGATTADANTEEAIHAATTELVQALIDANDLEEDMLAADIKKKQKKGNCNTGSRH